MSLAAPTSLDRLFRAAALRHPEGCALADDDRRLSYVEVDRAATLIAARLRGLKLQRGAKIAVQLPNTVDVILALLAIHRAGLAAVTLPLLWRREAVDALRRVGVEALIGTESALAIAAKVFTIRHVLGFGRGLPNGMVALDDPASALDEAALGAPAAEGTLITFDPRAEGAIPVARGPTALTAAADGVRTAARIGPDAVILGTMLTQSFPALASTLGLWLRTGGTLALHQPFDPAAFARLRARLQPDVLVLPGPVLPAFAEAGLVADETALAIWHAPERLASAPCRSGVTDIRLLGDGTLGVTARGPDGRPGRLRDDVAQAAAGTVAVGGCRALRAELEAAVAAADPRARLTILPDALAGQRLVGTAPDHAAVREALAREGASPLLVAAFRSPS